MAHTLVSIGYAWLLSVQSNLSVKFTKDHDDVFYGSLWMQGMLKAFEVQFLVSASRSFDNTSY